MALTWRRGATRRQRNIAPEANLEAVAGTEHSPAESAEQRERVEQLYRALQSLSETERALVVLMLDGLSYREVAEITGMTENHVGVALTRARRRLAERLKGVNE